MISDKEVSIFIAYAVLLAVVVIALFVVWLNRYRAIGGQTHAGKVRSAAANWVGLCLVIAGAAVFFMEHGLPAELDGEIGFPEHFLTFCLILGIGLFIWNHWDNPRVWSTSGKRSWWI